MAQHNDVMNAQGQKRGRELHLRTAPDRTGEGDWPWPSSSSSRTFRRSLPSFGSKTRTCRLHRRPSGGVCDVDAARQDRRHLQWINGEIRRLMATKDSAARFGSWVSPTEMVTVYE
jgi:hypothetical protein